MFDFTNRVVIVTGGSGALGSTAVSMFANAHATLVIPDRKQGRTAQLFPTLAHTNAHFLADEYNVTHPDEMARLVTDTMSRYGRIDILVNTIGGYRAGQLPHATTLETWDTMMNLNAKTTFITSQAVVPAMQQGTYGRIINIAARAAQRGGANNAAYSAAKAAILRLTESFAAAYKKDGITTNAILPSIIDTDANRQAMPNADFSQWVTPHAIAQIILFLASESAAIINGVALPV